MPKKPKITVREIKKDIKVTEIKKEEPQEDFSDKEEVPLEEIASSAPSSLLFPQFQQGQQPQFTPQDLPSESQAEQTQAEQAGPRYAVRNVTEGELRRVYGVAESRDSAQQTSSRNPMLLEMRQSREDAFMNRSLVDKRADENEEEKYSRPTDMGPKKETKHYPWEA